MEQNIVAIDPGTSKIIAMIARKESSGKLSILRTEKVDSEKCIQRGFIYNVDATAEKIAYLLNRLNENYAKPRLHAPIERVYVSIGGQSLHTERYSIRKQVVNGMIDQPLMNEINEEIKNYKPELYEVLEILSPEYYVDGQLTDNPRGTTNVSSIEARYQLIVVSRPNLKNLIRKAIPENIEIAGYIVAPLATAAAVLEKNEKKLGCALVEFGAGVTYVSIYKNESLKYLVTIPLGGLVVSMDIRGLNVSIEEAEDLKKNEGSAIRDMDDLKKIDIDEGLTTTREIEVRELNRIIEARINEILENVIHQIQESGYGDALGSGIVITGGGATLRGLKESFRNKMNKNLRIAYPTANETSQPAENSTIIGLLTLAKDNCIETAVKEPVIKPNQDKDIFENEDLTIKFPSSKPTVKKPELTKPAENKGNIIRRWVKTVDNMTKSLFEQDNENDNNEKN